MTPSAPSILREKFAELSEKNPQYTLRAFARELRMSSGALSEILSGKRACSAKRIRLLFESKFFDPSERNELARAAGYEVLSRKKPIRYSRLNSARTRVISEWWHFAILSLMKTKDFSPHPDWIAGRLGLEVTVVTQALDRLRELGLIRSDGGTLIRTQTAVTTPDDRVDLAVQKANLSLIQMTGRRLPKIPPASRDVTSYVMAIRPDKLPLAKRAIRQFQDELSDLLEGEGSTEVYQLGIQLFPLTFRESSLS